MIDKLKEIIFFIKKWIKHRLYWPLRGGEWVLGRHACLGRDVMKYHSEPIKVLNFQKARVDYFLSVLNGQKCQTKYRKIIKFLKRSDILTFLIELRYLGAEPKRPPKYILMDSYSELTDQLFEHKSEGWYFLANYGDLDINEAFLSQYKVHGLIKLEDIKAQYEKLFNCFNHKYKNAPIIFLHFPRQLETRQVFIERNNYIKKIISDMVLKYSNLYNIYIDENEVSFSNVDKFPYHYNEETYKIFYEKIKILNIM